jgi:hypothetical protein
LWRLAASPPTVAGLALDLETLSVVRFGLVVRATLVGERAEPVERVRRSELVATLATDRQALFETLPGPVDVTTSFECCPEVAETPSRLRPLV